MTSAATLRRVLRLVWVVRAAMCSNLLLAGVACSFIRRRGRRARSLRLGGARLTGVVPGQLVALEADARGVDRPLVEQLLSVVVAEEPLVAPRAVGRRPSERAEGRDGEALLGHRRALLAARSALGEVLDLDLVGLRDLVAVDDVERVDPPHVAPGQLLLVVAVDLALALVVLAGEPQALATRAKARVEADAAVVEGVEEPCPRRLGDRVALVVVAGRAPGRRARRRGEQEGGAEHRGDEQ